jgi:hypothetical protein
VHAPAERVGEGQGIGKARAGHGPTRALLRVETMISENGKYGGPAVQATSLEQRISSVVRAKYNSYIIGYTILEP